MMKKERKKALFCYESRTINRDCTFKTGNN